MASPLSCLLFLSGCLYHTQKLRTPRAPTVVMNADAVQLAASINHAFTAVQSMSATVDMQASVGGTHKGAITYYPSFRGFVLLRKPAMLRVLGLLPVVRTPAFDLASDGRTFKLLIPPQNKAITGSNSLTSKSSNPLQNLRPAVFLDSMLIPQIEPDDEVFLTTDSNVSQDPKTKQWIEEQDYVLSIVRAKQGASAFRQLIPERVIRFDRENLQPIEQDIYDRDGNIETQTFYGRPQTFGDEKFPGTVTIKRPLEEYQIVMTIQKLVLNQPLADDQFELKFPEGTPVEKMD